MQPYSGPLPDTLSQHSRSNTESLYEAQEAEIGRHYDGKDILLSPVLPTTNNRNSRNAPEVNYLHCAPEAVNISLGPEVIPNTGPEVVPYHPRTMSLSPTFSQGTFNINRNLAGNQTSSIAQGTEKEIDVAVKPLQRRVCGLPSKIFLALLAALLLLAALGAGLGAGLGLKKHAPAYVFTGNLPYSIGGTIDPAYYSTKGAFNGSGIAFAGSALRSTEKGRCLYTVYYQHHTGTIRYVQLSTSGKFEGGSLSEIVASDAKNSTAISVVNYVVDANQTNASSVSHVFYVGKDGFVKQRTWSNTSVLWTDGPVTAQELKVYDADRVGLQACHYGSFDGDTEVDNLPWSESAGSYALQQTGMHLWYADTENTFQQYYTYENMTSWIQQKKWTGMNGHGGVSCYSWHPGSKTYAMFVNQDNVVETWWKDTNSSLASTNKHPMSAWTNTTDIAIPNVYPSTSLSYTSYLYAMLDDSTIHGYNITFEAENSTFADEIVVEDNSGPVKFLNGTHLSVTATENGLLVFAQTEGDDVSIVCNSGETGKGVCAEDNGPFRLDSVCACATPSIAKISRNNNIWSLATLSRHDSATVSTVHGSADPVHDLDFNIATHAIPPLLQKRLSSSPGKVTPHDEAMLETIAAIFSLPFTLRRFLEEAQSFPSETSPTENYTINTTSLRLNAGTRLIELRLLQPLGVSPPCFTT
ncbi:hypothetical protein EG327_000315 [Venturia inaequalis]|uniref:Fucose-specific lectin n=1 Tax=Venturia inaequalis TaxID=5025 RepID=A0A8H3ZA06_VENIN|nr:hypothetical protein EG327_000315 [Venturia inaequalis]